MKKCSRSLYLIGLDSPAGRMEEIKMLNMHNPDDWGRIDCSQCQERNMCDQVQYDCPLDDPPLFPQSAEEVPPA